MTRKRGDEKRRPAGFFQDGAGDLAPGRDEEGRELPGVVGSE